MTRQKADEIENKINDFELALIDEINFIIQQNGDHTSYEEICKKRSKKKRELIKLIEEQINNVEKN